MKKETDYPSIDRTHLKNTTYLERHPVIPSLSFSTVLDVMFWMQGNHNIVDCLDLRVNSEEFQEDSKIIAKAFMELGIKKGDIIVVSMPNYYQGIPVFKACNMIGAITTFLNPLASIEETCNYLNMYESPIYISCDENESHQKKIKETTSVRHLITMKESLCNSRDFRSDKTCEIGSSDDLHFHELGLVADSHKGSYKRICTGKDDALILYTSGSTGKAKSLLFTNQNLVAACMYLKNSTHVPNPSPTDSRWMNVVPFMYPYGFGASVLQTFLSGREVILCPNMSPSNISEYYKKNPHLVFGSPAHLELTKRNVPEDQDLSSLKIYLSGGDYLSVSQSHEAIEFFKQHGADATICNSSGTGETLGCSTNAMNVPYRPETVGQLVVGPEYIILDPVNYEEVKYGEMGVLCTRGKHVFKGYYGNEDLTNETKIFYKGQEYYCTGNVGFLDKDRYFQLVGRASRFFIVNTLNKVYCEHVQNVVCAIDVVDSCAIVPKKDDETLYKCKAYIVLKPGVEPTDDVKEYILQKAKEPYIDPFTNEVVALKEYEFPCSISFLDTLPRTDSAEKVDYEYLRRCAEEEYEYEKNNTPPIARVLKK